MSACPLETPGGVFIYTAICVESEEAGEVAFAAVEGEMRNTDDTPPVQSHPTSRRGLFYAS